MVAARVNASLLLRCSLIIYAVAVATPGISFVALGSYARVYVNWKNQNFRIHNQNPFIWPSM
jgi:hypothetical protein